MAKVLIENVSENREQWKELRKGRIGGSDVPTILNLNKWKSALELWCEMTGKTPRVDQESRAAFYGTHVEDAIAKLFQHEHPEYEVLECNKTYVHEEYPYLICSPDRFLVCREDVKEFRKGDEGILEIKHTGYRDPDWDGGAPNYAHIQFLYQCGFLNRNFGHISAVIEGRANDVVDPFFRFDKGIYESIIEQVVNFKENFVDKDIPPEAGIGDSALIAQLVLDRKDETIILDDDVVVDIMRDYDIATQYLMEHKDEYEHWQNVQKTLKNRLAMKLDGKIYGQLPDGRVVSAKRIEKKGYFVEPKPYIDVRISSKNKKKGAKDE